MRMAALLLALVLPLCLEACSKQPWHMTDISGGMPRLDFHLARASDGAPVSGETYRGKLVALYFGYTHCPDVCPTTMANLTEMAQRLNRPDVAILFVTVDPDRDSLPVLKQYAAAFSPQVEGLRGDANALADVARRYRVAYTVKAGPPYEVMHSNAVFFFDPSGKARLVTTSTDDVTAMVEDAKRLLN